jgi:hypothetical protein
MSKLIQDVLDPIVYDIYSEFYILRYNLRLRFQDKTDKELKRIIKATRRVRYWNCGWITYVMATIIREIAQETIRLRKFEEIS